MFKSNIVLQLSFVRPIITLSLSLSLPTNKNSSERKNRVNISVIRKRCSWEISFSSIYSTIYYKRIYTRTVCTYRYVILHGVRKYASKNRRSRNEQFSNRQKKIKKQTSCTRMFSFRFRFRFCFFFSRF